MDIAWRRNRRLPKNPTSTGPLTDLPDYTFTDGRPTPLGVSTFFVDGWVEFSLFNLLCFENTEKTTNPEIRKKTNKN